MRSVSLRQYDLCVYKTYGQSLLLQSVQQYTGESRWLFILVQQCTNHNSEHRGGLHRVSRNSQWSFLIALKSLIVHSRRSKFRQDRAQGIPEDCQSNHERLLPGEKSKIFQNPSQSTAEFLKLCRRLCILSKNHWGQVILEQSLYFIREANPISSCNAKTLSLKPASQHHCSVKT